MNAKFSITYCRISVPSPEGKGRPFPSAPPAFTIRDGLASQTNPNSFPNRCVSRVSMVRSSPIESVCQHSGRPVILSLAGPGPFYFRLQALRNTGKGLDTSV